MLIYPCGRKVIAKRVSRSEIANHRGFIYMNQEKMSSNFLESVLESSDFLF